MLTVSNSPSMSCLLWC